ncbi:MAG: serine/threonine protein kinase, partial [Anaerolineae bacterium]|nr:serine/threonine protein kinase [Anaerolineae bacterium]
MMRRYEIGARIGGEFEIEDRRISEAGEIYFTRNVQDQQKWLLKTRSASQTLWREQIAYWLQAPLHAHLLAVGLQVEQHDGLLFMLLPMIQNEAGQHDLGEWLQDDVLTLPTVLKITLQIASGLNALHEAGMVHGNIKPGHILLRREGNITLTDFCLPDQVTVDASNAPYLAPETSRDIRSDIYALGSLLYQMLTGKSAFVGSTPSEIRTAHQSSTHESLSDDFPAALVSLFDRCLQLDPMQRYQTPAELLDDLAHIYTVSVGDMPSEVAPPQIPPLQIHWSRGQAYMALQQTEKAIEN